MRVSHNYLHLICFFMGLVASSQCWKHKKMWSGEKWGRTWEGGRERKRNKEQGESLLLVWVLRKWKSCCSDWCWVAVSHWQSSFLISVLRAAAYRKAGHCHPHTHTHAVTRTHTRSLSATHRNLLWVHELQAKVISLHQIQMIHNLIKQILSPGVFLKHTHLKHE